MKIKFVSAALAAFLLIIPFSTVAYAGGGEEVPEEPPAEVVTEPAPEPNPFTPAGTGTVIDNATDADGKEFYTIMTPDENVFYLVIDRQRGTENVYFLNAVTEADLMALAEASGDTAQNGVSAIPDTPAEPEPTPAPEPDPEPEAEPEKSGGAGMMIFVVLIVLAGGGAAYYFKIYRPKQEQADTGDDYDEYDEYGAEETEDDSPPWYEDDDTGYGEDGAEEYSEDDEA